MTATFYRPSFPAERPSMKWPQLIWSVFVIAVTIAIGSLVWFNLTTYLRSDRLVVISREEQRRLFELAIVLQDVENGTRGFLLTASPQFQAIHRNAELTLDEHLSAAAKTAPDIDIQERLGAMTELINARRTMLARMISLVEAGERDRAVEILQSESAMTNAAAIRRDMVELLGSADDRLQDRLTVCRQSMLAMTRWVMLGVAALVLSSSTLVVFMWRENVRQRHLSGELARARDAAMAGMRSRDEFLNVLSHELRTPLTPALMCISSMEAQVRHDPERRSELTMVRRQLELEARLIDDLLDVSRILRGEVNLTTSEVSVHELLAHLVDGCRESLENPMLKLNCSLCAARDRVQADESRLHQAFWHLLSNAIKFTPAEGTVALQTTNADNTIVIAISDTGIGMTAEQLADPFQVFRQADASRTRQFGGLGVGLAIVKSVVELHGGRISAQSPGKDRGSTFTVTLPLAKM